MRLRNQKGLSLIELTVSSLLLTTAIAGLLAVGPFITSTQNIDEGDAISYAILYGQLEIMQHAMLDLTEWDNQALDTWSNWLDYETWNGGQLVSTGYEWRYIVQEPVPGGDRVVTGEIRKTTGGS